MIPEPGQSSNDLAQPDRLILTGQIKIGQILAFPKVPLRDRGAVASRSSQRSKSLKSLDEMPQMRRATPREIWRGAPRNAEQRQLLC